MFCSWRTVFNFGAENRCSVDGVFSVPRLIQGRKDGLVSEKERRNVPFLMVVKSFHLKLGNSV